MSNQANGQNSPLRFHTAVVGGGIAGLYCALKLAEKLGPTNKIGLFEASPRFGGRIETVKLDDFICEFGPMRYELGIQPLLENLLINTLRLKYSTRDEPPYDGDIIKFPAFQTTVADWPQYLLQPDEKYPMTEQPYNALELMRLALIRLFKDTEWKTHGDVTNPNDEKHGEWLEALCDRNMYPGMRQRAELKGVPLWRLGFWNALSDVLSHQAILKIRDLGTFYHLIPENPNAIEWIIFWLRGLIPKPKGQLYTLKDGSDTITKKVLAKLDTEPYNGRVIRHPEYELVLLENSQSNRNDVRLRFKLGPSRYVDVEAGHVILAIPRTPLKKLSHFLTPETQKDLDAVFGFPLLKVFFTASKPWWGRREPVHTQADKIPTRELHYYLNLKGDLGMILLYTDRPGSEYWKIYVQGDVHDQAELDKDERIKGRFAKYLAERLQVEAEQYSPEQLERAATAFAAGADSTNLPSFPPGFNPQIYLLAHQLGSVDALAAEIEANLGRFGIRDWAREPYGAACHTWRPGTKSWEVLDRLTAFRLDSQPPLYIKNIHVCGEAYCDYNGFIEGSLRSAEEVLKTIRPLAFAAS